MRSEDLETLTLAEAAQRIRRRELSSTELTRAVLDRIAEWDPRTNAFITVTADQAIAAAVAADRALESGAEAGSLHGVPVSLKDLIDTVGIPTTAASRVLADRVPTADATVAGRLKAAGAVVVGKTSLHEFAFGVTNENPHYGPVRNPWDPERISGGSSGGSAVSVALSMALGSLGTDTGGSIRIPSALCGLVGLKPTYGRVSVAGVLPLSPSLDHVGPITRTVRDAAIMLEAIAGFDPDDPYSADVPTSPYSRELETGVAGLRLGVPRRQFFDRLEPAVESAVEAALGVLEDIGAVAVEVELPPAERHEEIFRLIATTEVFAWHEAYLRTSADLYGDDVRKRMEPGGDIRAVDYVRAERDRVALKSAVDAVLESVDLLVLPALPITAPRIGQTSIAWDDGAEPVLVALTRTTRLANLTGLPAVSVPCGFSEAGLPVGLQMIGPAFAESRVLAGAYAYEQNSAWGSRRPRS